MKPLPPAILLAVFSSTGSLVAAEPQPIPAEHLKFFEAKIRPVLIEHCYKCHSEKSEKLRAGLLLDTKQGALAGGESGQPGVMPGHPEESSVLEALTWANEDLQMPPKKKLPDEVVADFRKWIEMGAPDPREGKAAVAKSGREINVDEGRKFWSFQKPVKHEPPAAGGDWARTDIDRFLAAAMQDKGLRPAADADRRTLIRRIAFDLTGLPPSPAEVEAFVTDQSADAIEKVVDQYLNSPRYGEHWGRHWLDVARYGESSGKDALILYPHAWRYRDYVIDAFNSDKPYDRFLKEQLAGDLLPAANKKQQGDQIVATGFLAIGSKTHNERDKRQFIMNMIDEQIDAVSQAMLGLTIACARCHDHKFDPVRQRDYYALAGVFLSSETLYGTHRQLQNNHPSTLIELDRDSGQPAALAKISLAEVAKLKQRKADAEESAMELTKTVLTDRSKNGNTQLNALRARQLRDKAEEADADADLFDAQGNPRVLVMGVMDRFNPINTPLLVRGEISQPGDVVPRGLVEVLCDPGEPLNISQGSGRLDLAYVVASKDNPLTARVMANRIWLKLFGKGIVATPDNFGTMGSKPAHPELLDWLAVTFVENGWSVKKMIRQIMLSRAYQMSSAIDPRNHAIDPDVDFFWRMQKKRLDAESIRDAMLAVTGTIDFYPPDGSPVARAGDGREGIISIMRETTGQPYPYRTIYLPIVRDQIPEFLAVFDFPDASLVAGDRDATNVPSQGLYLLNNEAILKAADAFALRISRMNADPASKMRQAFMLAYGRPPTADESAAARSFFAKFTPPRPATRSASKMQSRQQAQFQSLSAFCQALLASAEFRYLN